MVRTLTEEHKRKISETLKGRSIPEETKVKISLNNAKYWKGKRLSDEVKKKISVATKLKMSTEEIKRKIIGVNKGKKLSSAHKEKLSLNHARFWKGKNLTLNTKKKLSESHLKYWSKLNKDERIERSKNWIKAGMSNPSSLEKIVCKVLDNLNIEYKTQLFIGHWFVDIFILDKNLIIECNGNYWHSLSARIVRDAKLQKYCDENNYKILWLWEGDIRKDENELTKNLCYLLKA